jgi:adenylate cyclase
MGIEIERKFLVAGDGWRAAATASTRFSQGYLSRDPARTVRVRIAGDAAFLTIKGATHGATRAEFEYAVPLADAQQMLAMCDGPVVEKVRHLCPHEGMTWEVDEFLGANAGLVLAEIELAGCGGHRRRPLRQRQPRSEAVQELGLGRCGYLCRDPVQRRLLPAGRC